MKRLTSVVVAVAMLAGVLSIPAAALAQGVASLTLAPSSTTVEVGAENYVYVKLLVQHASLVGGYTLVVAYDRTRLELVDADTIAEGLQVYNGPWPDASPPGFMPAQFAMSNASGGQVTIGNAHASGASTTGDTPSTIATMQFRPIAAGPASVSFVRSSGLWEFFGPDDNDLQCTVGDPVTINVVEPDTTAPTVMIVSPSQDGAAVGPRGLTVKADISDAGGVARDSILVEFKRPGQSYATVSSGEYTITASDPGAFYCVDWAVKETLSDGAYSVRVSARDLTGNSGSLERTLNVSSQVAEAQMTLVPAQPDGQAGWYVTEPRFKFAPIDSSTVKWVLVVSGLLAPSQDDGAWTDYSPADPDLGQAIGDGSWSLYFYVVNDVTGVKGPTSSAVPVKVDTARPAVQSVTLDPSEGALGLGRAVVMEVKAGSDETGLSGNAAFNGREVRLSPKAGSPGTYTGTYLVRDTDADAMNPSVTGVVLYDEAGNASASIGPVGSALVIDASLPVVMAPVTSPASPTNASSVDVTVKAKDATGLSAVYIVMDRGGSTVPGTDDLAALQGGPDGEGFYTYKKTLSLPEGETATHVVVAVVVDLGGNVTTSDPVSFLHDDQIALELTGPEGLVGADEQASAFYFNNASEPEVHITGVTEPGASVVVFYTAVVSHHLVKQSPPQRAGTGGAFDHRLMFPEDAEDGMYRVDIAVEDSVGNGEGAERYVVLDTTAPVVTITSPSQGAYTNQDTVIVTGTVTDANPWKAFVTVGGAEQPEPVDVDPSGTFTTSRLPITATQMAATVITIVAVDRAENVSVPATTTVVYSTTAIPLNVNIDGGGSLEPTHYTNKATVSLVIDTGGVVGAGVSVKVGDGQFAPLSRTEGVFRYEVDATGSPQLTFKAEAEGRTPSEKVFQFHYDTASPTFTVSIMQEGQSGPGTAKAGPVAVFVTSSETLLGVPAITVTPHGGAPIALTGVTGGGTSYGATYTVTENTPNGVASVTVSGVDLAGNQGNSEPASLYIDTVAPTFGISLSPDPAKAGPVTVTVTPSEELSGAPSAYIQPAPTVPADRIALVFSKSGDTWTGTAEIESGTPNGVATVVVSGTDLLGNEGADSSVTFTVDTVVPTATAEPAGGLYNTIEEVALTASEDGATIYYTVNGADPTRESPVYGEPIHIDEDTVLRFLAVDLAGNVSSVYSETYTIDRVPPTVSADPEGGLFKTPQTVTLTMSEPGRVYYTTDGSTPSAKSTLYEKPVSIGETTTLSFLAVDLAGNVSRAVTETYTIDMVAPGVTLAVTPTYAKVGAVSIGLVTDEPVGDPVVTVTCYGVGTGEVVAVTRDDPEDATVFSGTYSVTEAAPQGEAVVTAVVTDLSGNETTATETFVIDRVCELTGAFHDASGILAAGDTFQVFAVGEAGAKSVVVDLSSVGSIGKVVSMTPSVGGTTYYSDAFTVEEGDHSDYVLSVTMVDRAGNQKTVETCYPSGDTQPLLIDTEIPVLSQASVSPLLVKDGGTVTVTAQCNELVEAWFSIGSYACGVPMTCVDAVDHYECSGSLVIKGSTTGEFVVTVEALDRAGNIAQEVTAGTVAIDNTPPEIAVTVSGTKGLLGFYTSNVVVDVGLAGPDSTTGSLTCDLGLGGGKPVENVDYAVNAVGGSLELTLIADGTWALTAVGEDAVGNQSAPAVREYKIDKTPPAAPEIIVTTPSGETLTPAGGVYRTGSQSINVALTSTEQNLMGELRLNGQLRGRKPIPAGPSGAVFGPMSLKTTGTGENILTFTAVDQAGNVSPASTKTVVVDIVPPAFAIEFTYVEATNTATVRATATEPIADGWPTVTLRVGGGAGAVTRVDGAEMVQDSENTLLYTYTCVLSDEEEGLAAQGVAVTIKGQDAAGNAGVSSSTSAVVSSQGGTVGSDAVEAEIESGTFEGETQIVIKPLPPSVDANNTTIITLDLSAKDKETGSDLGAEQFLKPVTVTLRIPVPNGVNPEAFAVKTKLFVRAGDPPEYREARVGEDIVEPPQKTLSPDKSTLVITAKFIHFSEWKVTVDETPPDLAVTSPAENAVISTTEGNTGGQVSVAFNTTDTQSSPMNVTVALNGHNVAGVETVSGDGSVNVDLYSQYWIAGSNTLTVTSTDLAGNQTVRDVTVRYDVTAPAVTLNAVASPTNASNVAVSGSVEATDAGAEVTITNALTAATVKTNAAANGAFSAVVVLGNGSNTLSVTAEDDCGNVSPATVIPVVRDTTAPIITVNVPSVSATSAVTVTGGVSEPVTGMTVSVDGGAASAVTVTDLAFSVGVDLGAKGDHSVRFTASDAAGNSAQKSVTVKYDPDVPKITVTCQVPTITKEETVRIAGTSDPVCTVTVKRDGITAGVFQDGAFDIDVPLGIDGTKVITVRALNPANGLWAETSYVVERDSVPPTITIDPATPSNTTTPSAIIIGSADKTITGLTVNQVSKTATIGADGKSFSIPVTLASGANMFTITAIDRAGNVGTRVVTVTYTPPAADTTPTTPTTPSMTVGSPVETTIRAGAGGRTSNALAGIEVVIPAGALAEDVQTVLAEVLKTDKPVTQYEVARTFQVEFRSAATGEPVTTFETAYTLRLAYEPSKAPGTDPALLKVYYWNDAASVWVEVPSTLDTSTNTFTVTLPHATLFAIMADVSTVAKPTLAKVPADSLRGKMWLATGTALPGSAVKVVVNNTVQTTATANAAGKWQAWVSLKKGVNSVFAGSTARASAEIYPTYLPLVLTDIAGHWAEQYVKDLVDRNVITGYEDDTFRTENQITRAEFCTLIVKALGLEQDVSGSTGFADYADIPAWARPFVGAAAKAGIVLGFEDGTFRAGAKITRAEMATMISRSLGLRDVASSQKSVKTFTDDSSIPEWARAHIATTAGYKIIEGYQDSTFRPGNLATRAESATMVMRFIDVK